MKLLRTLVTLLLGLALACCTQAAARPESAESAAARPPLFVVAANPLAAEAGMAVLRAGGSAADAAVAVQAMLSLVEPQSSGIGGGAFMTWFDGPTGEVTVYDGRETAPAGALPTMFLGPDGRPLPFPAAVTSGRATGVPGAVRMLAMVQAEHGKLPWRELFGDAERTAAEGFIVSPRLGRFLQGRFAQLAAPDAQAYFAEGDGTLLDPGDRLRNPAYAEFLHRLAEQGPDALYTGETAQRIVARTTAEPLAGTMTLADLAAYRPIRRSWRCRSRECSTRPTSPGARR